MRNGSSIIMMFSSPNHNPIASQKSNMHSSFTDSTDDSTDKTTNAEFMRVVFPKAFRASSVKPEKPRGPTP